ncbi:MAG: hypothetical protein WDN08_13010 [Rhizomicrobium sp.]
MFEVEYWSLEQAKLGKGTERFWRARSASSPAAARASAPRPRRPSPPKGRRSPSSTATATPAVKAAKAIHKNALAIECDVTDAASVRAAFDKVVEAFGASTSWSPMPVPPGRAISARSTTKCCANPSS